MKKGKMIRVENDIVTIGMNNGSIKEVRRCDLGFDPVLGDLVEIFEDEDQIIVTKAKKEPENHNDAGININMTNSINNASDVAAGNGKKVVNKVAYCLLALSLVVSVLISFTVERLGWESSILCFVGQRFQVLLHG